MELPQEEQQKLKQKMERRKDFFSTLMERLCLAKYSIIKWLCFFFEKILFIVWFWKVNITLKKPGYKLEHQGIKIEFLGQIELYYDRGNHHEFTSLVKELARPGELHHNTSYDFDFNQVEKPYEVYTGTNVKLRYATTFHIRNNFLSFNVSTFTLLHFQVLSKSNSRPPINRSGQRIRLSSPHPQFVSRNE